MKLLSLICKAIEERRYRHSYLKMIHESLNDCSERTRRTRTDAVYHTSHVTKQQWERQKNDSEGMEEHEYEHYHHRQKCQHQPVVPIPGDQTSLSISQISDFPPAVLTLPGPLSTTFCLPPYHDHLQMSHILLQNYDHDHDLCHFRRPWQTAQ